MNSPSLPALAVESLEESSTAGAPSVPSKSTITVAGYSCSARMTASLSHSPSGTTSRPSTGDPGLDAWISSRAASRARTSAPPDAVPASPENARDSGRKWPGLLAKYDHATSSWKTAQCSLFEDSEPSLEIWPRWGSMRNGVAYQRQKPARLTSGNGFGFWPTPRSCSAMAATITPESAWSENRFPNLETIVGRRTWPTIRSTDADRGGRGDLIQAIRGNPNSHYRMWQTPVSDGALDRKAGKFNCRGEPKLSAEVLLLSSHGQQTQRMRLNPEWVEWLMGWPLGWTDLKPLGMDRFREWLRQHGLNCSGIELHPIRGCLHVDVDLQ